MITFTPEETKLLGQLCVYGYRPGTGEILSDHALQSCRILWLISQDYSVAEVKNYLNVGWKTMRSCLWVYWKTKYPVVAR